MKIICVGMNYANHNKEMSHTLINKEPVLFLKADSALLKNGKPFFIPDFSSEIHHEIEVVVRINKLGKHIDARFAPRYYNEITVGIDFTARDLQRRLREEGMPWEISKSFDDSAVVGTFISLNDIKGKIDGLDFHLLKNGDTVQQGNTEQMIFSVNEIIAYASRFFTLKIGDLIFTGTPAGIGTVAINDHLEGFLEQRKLLEFYVR